MLKREERYCHLEKGLSKKKLAAVRRDWQEGRRWGLEAAIGLHFRMSGVPKLRRLIVILVSGCLISDSELLNIWTLDTKAEKNRSSEFQEVLSRQLRHGDLKSMIVS